MVITIATVFYAVALALVLNPSDLAPGGVSGLSVILTRVIPMPVSLGQWILLLNIPIMILGLRAFGKRFVFSTAYTLLVSTLLVDRMSDLVSDIRVSDDMILNALIGGVLMGGSMGAIFRMDATTGGTDVIVKLIRQHRPNMKSGQIFLIADGLVVLLSAIVFRKMELALYAVVTIYVSSVTMNRILYGMDEALSLYIVSEKKDKMKEKLLKEVNVGITILNGSGGYTGENREIMMCVIHKQSWVKVRKLIKELDSNAFVIISKVDQVFGEGFQNPVEPEQ
ncbi:MAG: YitT family protein [Eubacterium sp.]|nr:YitT family protein [Eubacterium sp.]